MTRERDTYICGSEIGRGGMGVVMSGWSRTMRRHVAVKRSTVPMALEYEILRHVSSCDGVVQVYAHEEADGGSTLVMERIDGEDLRSLQTRSIDPLPLSDILRWMEALCEIVGQLHALSPAVVYADIKPSNIMIDCHGQVRLIDFGAARFVSDKARDHRDVVTFSRGYSPIEQYRVGPLDARADVYALGATLYALITGLVPPAAVDLALGMERLIAPSERVRNLPVALEVLILRMMSSNIHLRPTHMDEVRDALRDIRERLVDAPPVARREIVDPPTLYMPRRRLRWNTVPLAGMSRATPVTGR